MEINKHELTFTLSVQELNVWMTALKRAAAESTGTIIPWDSCGFYQQHKTLSRLTGYGAGDHEELREKLSRKNKAVDAPK